MRFILQFELQGKGPYILPINYQYLLSSWIYKTIHNGDNQFASWLHQQGYLDKQRSYKLFTFSQLNIDKFKVEKDRLIIQNPIASLTAGFFADEAAEPFIKGLFTKQKGSIGDNQSVVDFHIQQIYKAEEPEITNHATFDTLSPVIISQTPEDRNKAAQYLSPEDREFGRIMHQNLMNKYTAWMMSEAGAGSSLDFGTDGLYDFQLIGTPKPRLITIKANTPQQTKVKGYMMRFSMKAPTPLLKMGYHAGFGEKNSLGFGCVEVVG